MVRIVLTGTCCHPCHPVPAVARAVGFIFAACSGRRDTSTVWVSRHSCLMYNAFLGFPSADLSEYVREGSTAVYCKMEVPRHYSIEKTMLKQSETLSI